MDIRKGNDMKYSMKKTGMLFLSLIIFLTTSLTTFAWDIKTIDQKIQQTATYLTQTVKEPQIGSTGGEWVILGLKRSGVTVPKTYYDGYYKRLEAYTKECKGVLHPRRYTTYSRVIIALTTLEKNPMNVAGYDLVKPLGDYNATNLQGINGAIWALIALDSGDYEMPINTEAKVKSTRQMYVDKILSSQLRSGGFSLDGQEPSEVDLTSMALVALSNYRDQELVQKAIDKGLGYLSKAQEKDGGFISYGDECTESDAQVILALTTLSIGLDDERFVKSGHNVIDHLMSFYTEEGGFKHSLKDTKPNLMSTEQGFYALVAIKRSVEGKSSLFQIKEKAQKEQVKETAVKGAEKTAQAKSNK